ncbi:MAG: autotransporter-associated beta strand repeat-containing protein, partial [Kiritimatiellaeota bacterium]|nr:autotransporter-associated beta strand repeat-containing protein [Kiritimatiellota bacterium]
MKRIMTAMAVGAVCVTAVRAEWVANGETATADYLTAGNWAGGEIDDTFLDAIYWRGMTLYFTNDHTVAGDLVSMWDGANAGTHLTLADDGGGRTLTLAGNVVHQPGIILSYEMFGKEELELRLGNDGMAIHVPDTGTPHAFWAGTATKAHNIVINSWLTGDGDIVKRGAGTLTIANNLNTFTGTLTAHDGILCLYGAQALPSDANSVVTLDNAVLQIDYGWLANWSSGVAGRRFAFTNGTIRIPNNAWGCDGILCADTPIVKDGMGTLRLYGDQTNAFTRGMIVKNGTVTLDSPESVGHDMAGNDFVVNGGSVVLGSGIELGSLQKAVADTTEGHLGGIGVTGNNTLFPAIGVIGDGRGVAMVTGRSQPVQADPWLMFCVTNGWYIGGIGTAYFWPSQPLPAVDDKTYRLGGGGSGTLILDAPNVVSGDHGLIVGSPKRGGLGGVNLRERQDYTGPTLIHAPAAYPGHGLVFALMAGSENPVSLATSEIRIRSATEAMADFVIQSVDNAFVQRVPATSPMVFESAGVPNAPNPNDATLRIDPNPVNGATAVHGIGPLVLLSGRAKIIQGFGSMGASPFFLKTEAGTLTRMNRSIASVQRRHETEESSGVCNPPLGTWRTASANLVPGGNQFTLSAPWPFVSGNGASGTAQPIIPFVYGSGNGIVRPFSLVTYDETDGFRTLRTAMDADGNPAEFCVNPDFTLVSPDDNIYIATAQTVSDSVTVGSLLLDGTLTIAEDTVLTVKHGVMAGYPVAGADGVGESCVVDFGDAEGFL